MPLTHTAPQAPDSGTGELQRAALAQIIGASPAHARMLEQLQRIGLSEAPTLIEGDTGSGKELAARAIHYGGPRASGPFVPVNCGALPDTLIEAELFGHERGAFTDARRARTGLVAEAHRGTLFLDEVDTLSIKAQVTLLRFLQDQRYRPVGTSRECASDVRVIAAANRPLDALIAREAFRPDLLYRLKVLHLWLPTLRERAGDAELLAEHFIQRLVAKYGKPAKSLAPGTRLWMRSHAWPGNVRELENWVHREFLMCRGSVIEYAGDPRPAAAERAVCPMLSFQQAKAEALLNFEREYVIAALRQAGGNVTCAARLAGTERRAFGKLLKKLGITQSAKLALQTCADRP